MVINDNNYDNTVNGHDEENNILWSKYNVIEYTLCTIYIP